MIEILQEGSDINQSNVWDRKSHRYFIEIGKEQRDGAITATVMKMNGIPVGDGPTLCKRMGGVRIEPSGRITRWPTSTKAERIQAQITGLARFDEMYTRVAGSNV